MARVDSDGDVGDALLEAAAQVRLASVNGAPPKADAIRQRVTEIRQLLAEASESAAEQSDKRRRNQLAKVASAYGEDARASLRTAYIMYWTAGLMAALAFAATWLGVVTIADSVRWSPELVARLLLVLVPLVSSVPLWVQADRYRRTSGENRRLERQWSAIEDYLSPMPERAQTILRVALATRVFSRIIDDTEPLKDPIWPSAADLYPSDPSEPD